jgi:formate dehydrogenase subunit beta
MAFEQQKQELIEICKKVLADGKAKVIIGYTSGEPDVACTPFFMRTAEDVEKLKWDNSCTPNLAKYLLEKKEDVAIIAKACDARAIVMYMIENQIKRENVFIIGVECEGMHDSEGKPSPGCAECILRTPPIYDVLVKADGLEKSVEAAKEARKNKAQIEDKLARFQEEMEKCILCYTCRQGCYGCYCETCFMDRGIPNWLPSNVDIGTKMFFHLGRAMHLAGRCVDCGACERACPSGVNIRYLVRELNDFCEELYGYVPGTDPDVKQAMLAFDPDDREVGFLGGDDNESCCGS